MKIPPIREYDDRVCAVYVEWISVRWRSAIPFRYAIEDQLDSLARIKRVLILFIYELIAI